MKGLDERAARAIAAGEIEAFLDGETARDRDALAGWLNGDDLGAHVLLLLAEAAAKSGRFALLDPSRQLIFEEYRYLRGAAAAADDGSGSPHGPGGGARPSGKTFSIAAFERDRSVPIGLSFEATRYAIGATDPVSPLDEAHALLLREQVEQAAQHPSLDDLVAEKLARDPTAVPDPHDPGRLARLYEGRYVAIHLRALKLAGPGAANLLRRRLEQLTGVKPAAGASAAEFVRSVEQWYAENAPYLEVDLDQLPPRPFGRGWVRPDLFAKLVGRAGPRPADDDPQRKAFETLAKERREALAAGSATRRAQDLAAWRAWLDAELAALPKAPRST